MYVTFDIGLKIIIKGKTILPKRSAHSFVVHIRLVLMEAPEPGDGLAVHQLEDALLPVGPLDELGTTLFVLKICTL